MYIYPVAPENTKSECPHCHQMVIPKDFSCPLCNYTIIAIRVKFDAIEELGINFCILKCPDKSEKECAECLEALKEGRIWKDDDINNYDRS
jgi:hypothetical protein